MMKKILLLALALCLLVSCAACSLFAKPEESKEEFETKPSKNEEDTIKAPTLGTEDTEPSEDTTEDSILESTAPVYELLLPAEEQIAIFVANRELWYPVDDYYVPYSYTVCDLDQNGRLELVINICMGTGFFSENYFWEINESLDGVIACENPFVDYASQVDLGYPETNVYYEAESGVYYYMAEDFIRNGWAFSATEKHAISLEDGQLKDRLLASSATENFEDGSQTVTCTDDAGNEISQEAYDTVEQTLFADLKPMTAKFLWQAEYIEDTDLLDADGWHRLLEEAWQGFSLEEK